MYFNIRKYVYFRETQKLIPEDSIKRSYISLEHSSRVYPPPGRPQLQLSNADEERVDRGDEALALGAFGGVEATQARV